MVRNSRACFFIFFEISKYVPRKMEISVMPKNRTQNDVVNTNHEYSNVFHSWLLLNIYNKCAQINSESIIFTIIRQNLFILTIFLFWKAVQLLFAIVNLHIFARIWLFQYSSSTNLSRIRRFRGFLRAKLAENGSKRLHLRMIFNKIWIVTRFTFVVFISDFGEFSAVPPSSFFSVSFSRFWSFRRLIFLFAFQRFLLETF